MSTYYEPGRYWVQIADHGLTESKTKKTPQFFVKFLVLGKVNHEDPNKYDEGQEQFGRTAYRAITVKTKDWVRQDLETLGYEGSLERFGDGEALRDKMVTMSCEHDPYEGDVNERWKVPSEAAEITRMDTRAVAKLDKLLGITKGAAKSTPKAAEPASTPAEPEAPAPVPAEGDVQPADDSSIPF